MYVLRLYCKDKPGIVAAVATTLSNNQCNIEESSQFHDSFSNQFFMRVVFTPMQDGCLNAFKKSFEEIATEFDMTHLVCDLSQPIKTLIMVSQHDHCLHDLLYRLNKNSLSLDVAGVVSNHDVTHNMVERYNIPFHYLPVSKENKTEQEATTQKIIDDNDVELIIMARYMQILSDDFCTANEGKVINIHHSFLPGFKGARPYHQAYERGVKIIGATAHFATAELDEGPIITQNIVPVDHRDTPETMQRMGQDTESRVLARAVKLYTEHRIFINGRRTIIL